MKSVTSLVLNKKKSHCYSLRFLRKAPTKNIPEKTPKGLPTKPLEKGRKTPNSGNRNSDEQFNRKY